MKNHYPLRGSHGINYKVQVSHQAMIVHLDMTLANLDKCCLSSRNINVVRSFSYKWKGKLKMEKKQYNGCALSFVAVLSLSLILLILKLMGVPLKWIVVVAPISGSIIIFLILLFLSAVTHLILQIADKMRG